MVPLVQSKALSASSVNINPDESKMPPCLLFMGKILYATFLIMYALNL